ncbi:SAV_2336 N-terminal domain-related protein [Streptomyces olivaceoviridis]
MTGRVDRSSSLLEALGELLKFRGGRPSAEDLADVLWIYQQAKPNPVAMSTPPTTATSDSAAGASASPEKPDKLSPAEQSPQERQATALPGHDRQSAKGPKVRLHVYGGAARTSSDNDTHIVRVSRPSLLRDPLLLSRALRPLRQLIRDSGPPSLDENGTAQASSDAGYLLPVWQPATRRRFGIDLVVDTGTTMAVWHQLAVELYTLLERQGAFRDVRCWAMNTDHATPRLMPFRRRRINTMPDLRPSSEWHRPLHDPTNCRILLILTDGVGPAWYGNELPALLKRAVTTRPTAALQVLPRRLWHRTGLPTASVEARVVDPANPSPSFRSDTGLLSIRRDARTVWLPVMEVHGSWLAPWAEQLAGRKPGWVRMLATPLSNSPRAAGRYASMEAPVTAAERVSQFQSGTTKEVYRLACHLAAVPLSLPVMRIVQQAIAPDTNQTDLAQLFLSGIITRRRDQVSEDPDEIIYDFMPGVRDELLAELTRNESLQLLEILAKISGRVAATFGGTLDFRALASLVTESSNDSIGKIDPRSIPFAEVAVAVLSGAGGQHRSIASLLERAVNAHLGDHSDAAEDASRPERRVWHPGEIYEGIVISVATEGAYLNLDSDEAFLPSSERSANNELQVGDSVEVEVLERRTDRGFPCVSERRALLTQAWRNLQKVKDDDEVIIARVREVVKGGLILDIQGLRGFLPASLIEVQRVHNLQPYINRVLEVKILEINKDRNSLVVSRRALLEANQEKAREAVLNSLQRGQVREGVVSSIVNFGVFVDLGGLDGLVHISELSWHHVDHPSEVVNVGEEVTVQVLDVDMDRGRVSLSIKATQEDPWQKFARTNQIGQIISGKVTKLVPFGAFVRVESGIEGLVHISELAENRLEVPEQAVQSDEEIFVKIIDIDLERRRIGLSVKKATESVRSLPAPEEWDPTEYGMPAQFDDQGNYIFPEGFDPEADEWKQGYERQREEWESQYAKAESLFRRHKVKVDATPQPREAMEVSPRVAASSLASDDALAALRARLLGLSEAESDAARTVVSADQAAAALRAKLARLNAESQQQVSNLVSTQALTELRTYLLSLSEAEPDAMEIVLGADQVSSELRRRLARLSAVSETSTGTPVSDEALATLRERLAQIREASATRAGSVDSDEALTSLRARLMGEIEDDSEEIRRRLASDDSLSALLGKLTKLREESETRASAFTSNQALAELRETLLRLREAESAATQAAMASDDALTALRARWKKLREESETHANPLASHQVLEKLRTTLLSLREAESAATQAAMVSDDALTVLQARLERLREESETRASALASNQALAELRETLLRLREAESAATQAAMAPGDALAELRKKLNEASPDVRE